MNDIEPCCAFCANLEDGICPYAGLVDKDESYEKVCFGYIGKSDC